MTAYNSLDALKYLAKRTNGTVGWVADSASCALADHPHPAISIEPELDALSEFIDEMNSLLGPIVLDWGNYSDGRPVSTRVDIEQGYTFEHVWHPDPAKNTAGVLTGRRQADPGEDNGSWEVHILPPSTVRVVLLPPKPVLRAVPAE